MAHGGPSSNKPKGVAGNTLKAPKKGTKRAHNAEDPDADYQDSASGGTTSNAGSQSKKKQKKSNKSTKKDENLPEMPAVIDPDDDGWNNRTSPVQGQEDWSLDNFPDILYCLYGYPEYFVRQPRPTATKRIHGKDLPDFPILPDNISSKVEEFRVEAWLRLDNRIQLADIVDRIHPAFRIKKNALQMRVGRFRSDCNMIKWKSGNSKSEPIKERVRRLLRENGIDESLNTTRGITPGLIIPDLGEAGGRIPMPKDTEDQFVGRRSSRVKTRRSRAKEIAARGSVGESAVGNPDVGNSQAGNSQLDNLQSGNSRADDGQGYEDGVVNSQVSNFQLDDFQDDSSEVDDVQSDDDHSDEGEIGNSQANSQLDNFQSGNSGADDGQGYKDGVNNSQASNFKLDNFQDDNSGVDYGQSGDGQGNEDRVEKREDGGHQPVKAQIKEDPDDNGQIYQDNNHNFEMKIEDVLPQEPIIVKVEEQPPILNGDDWLDLGLESEVDEPNEEAEARVKDFRYQGITQQDIDTLFAPENAYDQTVRDVATEVSANMDMLDGPAVEDPEAEEEAEMIERLLEHFLQKQRRRGGQLRNMRNLPHLRSLMALHM